MGVDSATEEVRGRFVRGLSGTPVTRGGRVGREVGHVSLTDAERLGSHWTDEDGVVT